MSAHTQFMRAWEMALQRREREMEFPKQIGTTGDGKTIYTHTRESLLIRELCDADKFLDRARAAVTVGQVLDYWHDYETARGLSSESVWSMVMSIDGSYGTK